MFLVHQHRPWRKFLFKIKDTSQNTSFQKFFWTILYLFNWGDQSSNKIGAYSPRSTCLSRLVAHIVNVFFIDSVFFHLGDITFQWYYAPLIVLEDFHIPVSISTFFQYLLSIYQDSYPDWVVTIKSVSFIWVSSSVLYLLMVKTLTSTKLYNFDEMFL